MQTSRSKIRTVIFGAGGGGNILYSAIDHDKFDLVAFSDNNHDYYGTEVFGLPVVPPNDLLRMDPDLVIISTSMEYEREIYHQLEQIGIQPGRIICSSFLKSTSVETRLAAFQLEPDPIQTAVSGISYFACGFLPKVWPQPAFNFAWNSQDLFYDYKLACHVLNAPEGASIHTWIIGLAYYSLHYDMTLSRKWLRSFHYSTLFGFHNLSKQQQDDNIYNRQATIVASFPFDRRFRKRLFRAETKLLHKTDTSVVSPGEASRQAKIDSNKDYPLTVEENTGILIKFLELLTRKNIHPVIAVAPVHPSYREITPLKLKKQFNAVVSSLESTYNCSIADCFYHEDFVSDYFQDAAHLNSHGAYAFTKLLVDQIRFN